MLAERMKSLSPYVPGEQPQDKKYIKLNTNENPYSPSPKIKQFLENFEIEKLRLYPDPLSAKLKAVIANDKNLSPENVFISNGSDEALSFAYYAFFDSLRGELLFPEFTYSFYPVYADYYGIPYKRVPLDPQFNINFKDYLSQKACGIILPNPNAPTGIALPMSDIRHFLDTYEKDRVVIIDEAYIDFSTQPSFLKELNRYPNLIVMQTLSKAWGSAGVRMGMVYASEEIIYLFNKVKHPYNINYLTQEYVLKLMDKSSQIQEWIQILLKEREVLCRNLRRLSFVKTVYPSDANFLLVKMEDANAVYEYMVKRGIIMRNRNSVSLCRNCIRITVGEPEENKILLEVLSAFPKHKEEINNT